MQLAEAVWVTEDSVSMLYEALTAGCKVGLIEIDRIKDDRITRQIDQLYLNKAKDLSGVGLLSLQLSEADRVAALLSKF